MKDVAVIYDFKVFKDEKKASTEPLVTISKSGTMSFNSSFFQKYSDQVSGKDYIKIGYSENNIAIVIIFITAEEINESFTPLRLTSKNASNRSCSVRNFLKKYNLNPVDVQGRYSIEHNKLLPGNGDYFVIYLAK